MTSTGFDFHRSLNQAPPLQDYNAFDTNDVLGKAMNAYGAGRMQEEQLYRLMAQPGDHVFQARVLVEKLALAIQAIELIRIAPPLVAKLFCAARLSAERSVSWGTLRDEQGLDEVINRTYLYNNLTVR